MNVRNFKSIEGGCLCAAIRYRITSPPLSWLMVPADGFKLLAGKPGEFHSTPYGTRQFCQSCGTQLTFRHAATPDEIDVTGASLDDPDEHPPQYSMWSGSRRNYTVNIDAGLPIFEEDRDS